MATVTTRTAMRDSVEKGVPIRSAVNVYATTSEGY
jgi:hypothetical protein